MTGKVEILGAGTSPTISLNGDSGTIAAGANGANGILRLADKSGTLWWGILLDAQARSMHFNKMLSPNEQGAFPVISVHGASGNIGIGGNGQEGSIGIYPAGVNGTNPHGDLAKANIHLAGADGYIRLGGAAGAGGHLALYPAGTSSADLANPSKASIHLDGQTGDIILGNADCAEDFEIAEPEEADPGTVMVIREDGHLHRSDRPYDKRVAGVISGAKELRPGIVLGRKSASRTRQPVALVGQVYCKADAAYGAIEVGDLLTTSHTSGHAMCAQDHVKAFGAVLGKALTSLQAGQALIRILVALQ